MKNHVATNILTQFEIPKNGDLTTYQMPHSKTPRISKYSSVLENLWVFLRYSFGFNMFQHDGIRWFCGQVQRWENVQISRLGGLSSGGGRQGLRGSNPPAPGRGKAQRNKSSAWWLKKDSSWYVNRKKRDGDPQLTLIYGYRSALSILKRDSFILFE